MYKSISYWFSFFYSILLLMTFVSDNYAAISIVLFVLIILSILYKLGQGIVMLESISLFYVFTCLVMPVFGYKYYNYENGLAKLFKRFMQVPEQDYFGYALPALILFSFILTFPLNRRNYMDSGEFLFQHINKIKEFVKINPNTGVTIMIVGTVQLLFGGIFPDSLRFFFDIFFFSSFAGLLSTVLFIKTGY